MLKKIFIAVLCVAMTISLAACGGSAPATEESNAPSVTEQASADEQKQENNEVAQSSADTEPVTLTLMGKAVDLSKPYVQKALAYYEETTGNKLDIIGLDDDTYETVATSKFATGDIPDIFVHFNNAVLDNYTPSEHFYYMNDEAWVDELTDTARNYIKDTEGNLLGLPFNESSVSGCYYNKAIFDELGLEPATTQAEYDELCQKLHDAGYTALCWPAGDARWMYQFGFDPIFADTPELLTKINSNEITYADIPETEAQYKWIKEAADKGWFGETYLTDGWDDLSEIMGTGEAAMILIWDTWFYTDFDESYDYTKDDFGVMPVFLNTVENGTYEGGNLNMYMVNKNGDQVEEALEFIRTLADVKVYDLAFDGIATTSIFKDQSTNVQSNMVLDAYESVNKYMRPPTAEPKIIGFTQADCASAAQELLMGNVDPAGCVKLLDDYRTTNAKALGTPGF